MNATNAATTPASTKVKTKRKRRSRNALIEARERMALEANLEVVGTPSRAFIPALAELLADRIIEKASAGEIHDSKPFSPDQGHSNVRSAVTLARKNTRKNAT